MSANPPPFPYSPYGGVNNGNVGATNNVQQKLFDNSFTSSNIYSRSPPQHSSSAGIENVHNTPDKVSRPPVQDSPGSATKCIEKSLQSLDELISQRRSELMELRSSNNKRFSQARPPVANMDSFKSLSPEDRIQQRISSLQSSGNSAGRISPAPIGTRASSDSQRNSPSYVSIPAALFEELNQSSHKAKVEGLRIVELQDSVQHLTAQFEFSNQRNKTLASKVEELEKLRDDMEEELLSSKDELLFLRSQLQTKSVKVSELETAVLSNSGNVVKQVTSPGGNGHSRVDEAEVAQLRQELDDAIDENNKWYQKVQEIEQQRVNLEEEKRYADSLVFDWEASYAKLEEEYMKVYDELQSVMKERQENGNARVESAQPASGAADSVVEELGKLKNFGKAWKQAYKYQRKKALLRSAFDSMRFNMLQKNYLESKAAATVTAAKSFDNTVCEGAIKESPSHTSNAPAVARRHHTTSFLLMLAFFQFIVWVLILAVGFFYIEDLSPNFATDLYHSLLQDFPALRSSVHSIANLFHREL